MANEKLLKYLLQTYGREALADALAPYKAAYKALPALQQHQTPPDLTDKSGWLFLAGRGAGKTFASAHWLLSQNVQYKRIVAATFSAARDIAVEGESGLLNMARDRVETWNRSIGELKMKDGSVIKLFSAESPERLRGSQSAADWYDELASWEYDQEAYDMARFGLRLGNSPQFVISTTPAPTKLVKSLLNDSTIAVTRASTTANSHLPSAFIKSIYEKYGNSVLGRQELEGELIESVAGALWSYDLLERCRIHEIDLDLMERIVVAIDPKAAGAGSASETGIIVAAKGKNGQGYILADYSSNGSATEWATAAVSAYERFKADAIIAESNQGGDMITSVLRSISANVPVKLVRATRGKFTRAEPVAALYDRGLIKHVGRFSDLEGQLASWKPGDASPDRLDALVWALTELFLQEETAPAQSFQYSYTDTSSRRRR